MDTTLLIIRLAAGLGLSAHGAQKAFGWFGGSGLSGARDMVQKLRFRPATLWVPAVIAAELGGGLLFALGLLAPLASVGVASAMLVAMSVHLPNGFFGSRRGFELPMESYLVPALALLVSGPGRWSLDSALGITWPEPVTGIAALVMIVLGVGTAFATRGPQPAAEVAGTPQPSHRPAGHAV